FGPDNVLAAALTSAEPPAPGALNRTTVGSWLFAPRQWRMQTLVVLLDAVRAAFRGGPLVVVGVPDLDEAASWIAAVSYAMSAGTARRFFFSTLERPATLAEAADRGLHLVCVPRRDLPTLNRREGIVVLDPDGVTDLGDLDGEPHRTPRGDAIEVGEWSVLIQELFSDPTAMAAAVTEFDRIAQSVGDSGLDPAWPAAMLVAARAASGSRRESGRVLAECAPPQLRSVPDLYAAALMALRGEVAGRPDRAWRQVVKAGAHLEENPPTVAGEVAVSVYAELALAAEPWLAGQGPAKLPSGHYYSPVPEPELVRLSRQLAPEISPFSADLTPQRMLDEVRAGLHFVELALRLGLAHDHDVSHRLYQVCQQSILPTLLHPELGPALIDTVDANVARETRHWLWSQLAALPLAGRPGERIAPAVLDALGPTAEDPDPLAATWAWLSDHPDPDTVDISPLIGELAWHRVLSGEVSDDARFFAAWGSLQAGGQDPVVVSAAARLLDEPWELERLIQLQLRWQRLVPTDWLVPALLAAPLTDPQAQYLAAELAAIDDPSPGGAFAGILGGLAEPDWLAADGARPTSPTELSRVLDTIADVLPRARTRTKPDREVLRRLNILVVLGLLAVRSRVAAGPDPVALERAAGRAQAAIAEFGAALTEAVPPGRAASLGFTTADIRPLIAWCDRAGVATSALTELFLLADPRSMLRRPADRVALWLHSIITGEPDTALVLVDRLHRNAASRDRTHDEALAALRSVPGSADDRAVRQTERFFTAWLRQALTGRVRR
ncbi:MAG: hypothetical protein Q4G46_07345, partial [Propionibacteriaceae bacterium]|nr:hypothetical protein [Propionibacteriaceae bacterium]